MISLKIVVPDIRCHILLHIGPRWLRHKQQPFMFQAAPEAFHYRVIPAGSNISHAASEPIALQHRLEAVGGVLGPSVRVHHQPVGRIAQVVNAKIIGRFSPFLMSAIGH